MLIDLHVHCWPYSDDSTATSDELITQAKAISLAGICLTDHDQMRDPAEIERLRSKHGFLVFSGLELTTEVGHMLVFGLRRYYSGLYYLSRLHAVAASDNAVVIPAHPYRHRVPHFPDSPSRRESALKAAAEVYRVGAYAALEGRNGRGSDDENGFSCDLAMSLRLPTIGGSDS